MQYLAVIIISCITVLLFTDIECFWNILLHQFVGSYKCFYAGQTQKGFDDCGVKVYVKMPL